ncbi:MAG: right-handed parallel beta-helix repeat-containing protein [Nanoarchaeota archaeon]
MGKKEAKVLILWLSVFIIMLSLLIAFPMLIGYVTHEGQQNIVNLTSCQDLTTSNATYYLQNDVSASGTCFNIMADNIILDGQGYIVNYSTAVQGHGINTSGRFSYGQGNANPAGRYKNLTIKNFKIIQNSSSGSGIRNAFAIFLFNTERTEIINNEINSYSGLFITKTNDSIISDNKIVSNNASGLATNLLKHSSVKNNDITTNGDSNFNQGILLFYFSTNNTIINNKISTNGGQTNIGIKLEYDVSNNTIKENRITTNGKSAYNSGIDLNGRNNGNFIINNIISTNGTNNNYGYYSSDSVNNFISGNDFSTNGNTTNYGIFTYDSTGCKRMTYSV